MSSARILSRRTMSSPAAIMRCSVSTCSAPICTFIASPLSPRSGLTRGCSCDGILTASKGRCKGATAVYAAKMKRRPNRNLVGVQEVADMLAISRQRADQLSRTSAFPQPVRFVLPLDDRTRATMLALEEAGGFPGGDAAACYEQIMATAHALPATPRLWRAADVSQWAADTGRL